MAHNIVRWACFSALNCYTMVLNLFETNYRYTSQLYFWVLQKDLNSLMKWECDWQMNLNPKKCFVMRLTHARHMTRFNYILGDKSLQETDNHPYLGVHITNDLTWNKHIHQITATANGTLAFVRRNLYSCPQHIKKSAYTTLVRPLLE